MFEVGYGKSSLYRVQVCMTVVNGWTWRRRRRRFRMMSMTNGKDETRIEISYLYDTCVCVRYVEDGRRRRIIKNYYSGSLFGESNTYHPSPSSLKSVHLWFPFRSTAADHFRDAPSHTNVAHTIPVEISRRTDNGGPDIFFSFFFF